jgi:hypothetical protein
MIIIYVFLISSVIVAQSSPSPVNLGSAEDFVVLAKTGITTTGTTDITGDLGISPAAATSITGFDLILDPLGTFSTSSLVTGKIYTSDYTDPTPAKLTAAISAMETAYTDAAGRTLPNYTELYGGDLTGQTLARGLYKWGTGVTVSAGGVTISGTSEDVWIFQIAQGLVLSNGANVYLSGGAKASNIYWQVAGQTTLSTTSVMHGVILCQTQIAMNTGAVLNGRAFAHTAATFDANIITDPVITSVDDDKIITTFLLEQNFPNPFNPSTVIQYSIEKASKVTLSLFSILGNEVATLVNKHQEAGSYSIQFNTTDLAFELSSGIYFSRLEAGSNVATKKLVFIK